MAAGSRDIAGRVCIGQIGAPHGVRGLVAVRAFTEVPENISAYGPVETEAGQIIELVVKSAKKGGLVVAIEGVASREVAAALSGQRLYVARDRLPAPDDEEWYQADLVGLSAEAGDGGALGRVIAVHDFGAGEILEIDPGDGATVFVPFTYAAVPVVDVVGGRLVIGDPQAYFEARSEGAGEGG